jgi:hypothetical protein
LKTNQDKDILVILVVKDVDESEASLVKESAVAYFLRGYRESDAVYDNY